MNAPAKLPPCDLDLEQAVLGSMITGRGSIDQFAGEIEARHFYDPLHARIFDMMVYLQTEGEVTPLVLASVLRNDPAKTEIDVSEYIRSLAAAAPAVVSTRQWCAHLKDLALLRRLHQIGGDLAELALNNPDQVPASAIAEQATETMLAATAEGQKPLQSPFDAGREAIKEIEDAVSGKSIPTILTGIEPLDLELGGLRGGDLITVLGKSGTGKSALMCGMSLLFAMSGVAVLVFSMEMSLRQWTERMVCDIDHLTHYRRPMWYSRVRNHRLIDDEFERFVLANQKLEGLPLEIIADGALSMFQISARARAFASKHKDKKIVVIGDYLQLIEPYDPRENRERQVGRIAYGLKQLAQRIDAPNIWGSQMNENDEARREQERRPRASDARESRGIMNASDIMLAPYRQAVAVENRRPLGLSNDSPDMASWAAEMAAVRNDFDLLCLKNRHGRRFDLKLWAEIGANAIRSRDPHDPVDTVSDQDRQGLLV